VYRKEDNERISVHEAGILRRGCMYGGRGFYGMSLQLFCLLIGIARRCSIVRWCVVCMSSVLRQIVNSRLVHQFWNRALSFGSRQASGPIKEPCDARVGLSHDNDEQRTCWGRMRAGILLVPSHASVCSPCRAYSTHPPSQCTIHIRVASPLRTQCIARS
jgi:hypothetical protein